VRNGCCRRRPAFTLVEILIVILVLAIAAAIVIPNIGSADDSRVTSAARILQADMEVARSLAMTTQQPYSVVFSPDFQSYKVVENYAGVPYAQAVAVGHPVNRGQLFEVTVGALNGMDDVRILGADFGGQSYATFMSLGDPAAAGSVLFQSGSIVMTVSVEGLTGIITVTRAGG
jgi:prepilin-type N-terminal cleavage/methylation domain-containing protein